MKLKPKFEVWKEHGQCPTYTLPYKDSSYSNLLLGIWRAWSQAESLKSQDSSPSSGFVFANVATKPANWQQVE